MLSIQRLGCNDDADPDDDGADGDAKDAPTLLKGLARLRNSRHSGWHAGEAAGNPICWNVFYGSGRKESLLLRVARLNNLPRTQYG